MKKSALLTTAFAMALCACGVDSLENSNESLHQEYADAFKIGCAINHSIASGRDSVANALVLHHFNAISPENELKAETIHPRPGVWNFGPADRYVEFGQKNNMHILGHTLVWHNQTPDFFFKNEDGTAKSKEEMTEVMREYIEKVVTRYNGKIDAWDVVNEIIDNDGSYRPTTWVNSFGGDGDAVVLNAFKFAEQYAPGTELYYNDFNAWRPEKRDGIARMVRMLQKNGVRIDGVGIQAHWGLNFPKNEYIIAAIDTFAALGVKVMITEMDIDVLPLTKEGQIIGKSMQEPQFQLEEFEIFFDPYKEGLPADVQTELTARYKELLQIFYDKRDKIDRVTFWGLHDSMSWKNDYPIPRRTNYPLLFNRDLTPKPAVEAILSIPD